MKQQKIEKVQPQKQPIIEFASTPKVPEVPQGVDKPVRAVNFVEVGDASNEHVKLLVSQINELYSEQKGGVHYIIPIRHGKITSDIIFEHEILELVNKLCEVVDGKIQLRGGTDDVLVVRHKI